MRVRVRVRVRVWVWVWVWVWVRARVRLPLELADGLQRLDAEEVLPRELEAALPRGGVELRVGFEHGEVVRGARREGALGRVRLVALVEGREEWGAVREGRGDGKGLVD